MLKFYYLLKKVSVTAVAECWHDELGPGYKVRLGLQVQ